MEALGAAGSIVGIAGFGLQIATTLQTYVEATLEADDRIRDIANDINATATTLQRLQAAISHDEKLPSGQDGGRIFNIEGLKSVNKIAAQCDAVFKRIVELLNKAGSAKTFGGELASSERRGDLKLSTLDSLKWPWLEPKISRCRQELERLLIKLLLMLQISNLVSQQSLAVGTREKTQTAEKEKELRNAISKLKSREVQLTRSLERALFKAPLSRGPPGPWEHLKGRTIMAVKPRHSFLKTEAITAWKRPQDRELSGEKEFKQREVPGPPGSPTIFNNQRQGNDITEQPDAKYVPTNSTTNPIYAGSPPEPAHIPGEPTVPAPEDAQPPPTSPDPLNDQYLEAYLLKGTQDQMLKIPLSQPELQKQLRTLLAKSELSIWNTLLSLTAKDQANINHAIENAKQKDKISRILTAIDIQPTGQILSIDKENDREYILIFLTKEVPNVPPPTWTRMARRDLSIETLQHYRLPHEIENDEFVLIKRWVPEYEQDLLWSHTRELRERRERPETVVLEIEGKKKHTRHRASSEDAEFEFVRKRHGRQAKPSPLQTFLSGGLRSKHQKKSRFEDEEEFSMKHRRNSSPLPTFFSGRRRHQGVVEGEVVDEEKVDDLLAQYTTCLPTDSMQEATDKNDIKKKHNAEEKEGEKEEKIEAEFLQTTALDDYFSADENEGSSISTRSSSSYSSRKRFKFNWRKFWPRRFRRKRRDAPLVSFLAGGSR